MADDSDPKSLCVQHLDFNAETKQYQCRICKKSSAYKANMLTHIESMHFSNKFVYSCKYCAKEFTNKTSRNNHVSRVHGSQKSSLVHEITLENIKYEDIKYEDVKHDYH